MNIILLSIVIGLTLFMVIRPDIVWKFRHILHVRDGEPTKLSLVAMRIAGAILSITAVALLIVTITHV